MHAHWMREGRQLRYWLTAGRLHLHLETTVLSGGCGISFGYVDESGWGGALRLPGLFSVWCFVRGLLPDLQRERMVEIRIFSGAIWWSIWRDWRDGWSRDVPRWRDGNFNFIDFALGRARCTKREIESRQVLVPMPERSYQATAQLTEYSWKRPRWFVRRMLRVQIEVPEGIPHEGKGENSWDCGTDATYAITTGLCRSIPEGVGVLVGSVLRDRVRYGGYTDWTWQRDQEAQA